MNILGKLAVRVIPVGIMAFLVVAVIAYQRGVYDITFIERPSDTITTTTSTETTTSDGTDGTTSPTESTTASDPQNEDPHADAIHAFLGSMRPSAELRADGYAVTDAEYTAAFAIAKLQTENDLDNIFTLRERTVYKPERIMNTLFSDYTTVMNPVVEARPLAEVYMDYLLIDNGTTVDILSKDGAVLCRNFEIDRYQPAYTRDRDDAALFKSETPSDDGKSTVTTYYKLDEFGRLIQSDYVDAADNRGLYINYPTYFGKSDNQYDVKYKDGLYGFANQKGYVSSYYRYTKAYNFSEGLAAVVDEEGELSYVQQNFYSKITCGKRYYLNDSRRRAYADYLVPDSLGIESVGFFYFDHGLVRIRKQEYDAYRFEQGSKEVNYDRDIVIRLDGTEYPIPKDYTVVGYSNGVFLLEKHGLFGFMDYTGKWIADPIYTHAEPFNEGLAKVERDGIEGLIDTDGNFVIPMLFDHVSSVSGGLIAAYDEACGWVFFNKMQK